MIMTPARFFIGGKNMAPENDPKYKNHEHPRIDYKNDMIEKYEAGAIGPQNIIDVRNDIENLLIEFMETTEDKNASKGMTNCYMETWQAFTWYVNNNYFKKNIYLWDIKRSEARGARVYDDKKIIELMDFYAELCTRYRKQFFISDFGTFCGMDYDYIYNLTHKISTLGKKANAYSESSLRTGLISNRGPAMGYAMLLNHDHGYATSRTVKEDPNTLNTAAELPTLNDTPLIG